MKPIIQPALASIIVPCFNQVEFTRLCVQSLFRHNRPAWELIAVDNGSTDGTADYLAGVRDAAAVPVTIVRNARNRGFPAAINQGLQQASGEFLVLLNNDAVVTDGWLDQLIALSEAPLEPGFGREMGNAETGKITEATEEVSTDGPATARIGLVGPMSNYASPPQLIEDVPYRDLDEMRAFARRWREQHRGQWFTAAKLSGFCVLIRRPVYEAIGGLDERFGLGFFDDDDLAERARRAGFALAVARDLFVHHFGSRTFVGGGIDAGKLLEENARRFADKWGRDRPAGRPVALRAWSEPPDFFADVQRRFAREVAGDGPAAAFKSSRDHDGSPGPAMAPDGRHRAARVSLTMIVRDEEANLPQCLGSVRGVFDEIVVVDTGSTDRTREIAREHGARVVEFDWIDDFAAARNVALEHATGDYAFWLDADDVIEPDQRGKLIGLLDGLKVGDPAAYVVRCACDPGQDGSGGETVVDHIRLFPLRPDVRWTYRVHEQILPALRRAGVPVRWTDLVVRHTGYVDVALRVQKLERDALILAEELLERPDDPFLLFNFGSIAIERRDWPTALEFLGRSLVRSAPSDSITRKLFALIARAHQMLGDSESALRVCAEGLSLDPEDAELWFRKAVVHRHRGEPTEAERCWRTILGLRRPEKFASVDMGIYGHLTRRNLAALAAERGDHGEEARLWGEVLAECPGDGEARARLERRRATTPPPREATIDTGPTPWIVPGSRRRTVPGRGPGDFDPYAPLAAAWVEALGARVVVELGVRFGDTTRALLEGARAVDGHVWGVDPLERHDVRDPRFTFIAADPIEASGLWERIDLLHVDVDPHGEEDARRWLAEYAGRCRAIAVHDTHHPRSRLAPVIADLAAAGSWRVFEYRGNAAGWTVLARPGEPIPAEDGGPADATGPEAAVASVG